MPTAAGIVNAALQFTAAQAPAVTGISPTFDSSVAGQAAQVIYLPTVQMLIRAMEPRFAWTVHNLVAQSNPTLIGNSAVPFAGELTYPADCLVLKELAPVQSSIVDINDPDSIRAMVAYDPLVTGGPAKVILCDPAAAVAVYYSSSVTEAQFDPSFVEALIRHLANPLGMAVAGRPDFAKELLEQAERYAALAAQSEDLL